MGQLVLHLPQTLQNELETMADQEGVSLDQYILYSLARQIERSSYSIRVLSENEREQQQQRFQRGIALLGEPSMAETQKILAERENAPPENGLTEELIERVERRLSD